MELKLDGLKDKNQNGFRYEHRNRNLFSRWKKMIKWISCKDRLPEPYKSVLLYITSIDYGDGVENLMMPYCYKYRTGFVNSEKIWRVDDFEYKARVTHWATLNHP